MAAIVDPDDRRRDVAVQAFRPGRAFCDVDQMLGSTDLDAVIVATPHQHHFAAAAAALGHGINVLVEKPMVIQPKHGRQLLELAAANNAELLVGYTLHSNAHVMRAREEVAAGAIGVVEHVSCVFASTARELYRGRPASYREVMMYGLAEPLPGTYADPGGGQAHTQLTHSAALALHVSGLRCARVSAFAAAFELGVDLADTLAIEFASGALGSLDSVGSVQPGHDEILQCRIFGDGGHLQLDTNQGWLSIHGLGGEVIQLEGLTPAERYPNQGPANNLIGVTLGEEANRSAGVLGQQVVELIDAAFRSAASGRVVELPAVPD